MRSRWILPQALGLSLAVLPVALAAAVLTVWEVAGCRREERTVLRPRDWAARLGVAAAGWSLPVFVLWIWGHINLLSVWQWNYRNHAAFYAHYARTYWKWLLVNPLEFALAVGLPIVAAALFGFRNLLAGGWRQRAMGPYWCLTGVGLLLSLSGKNMGEAARLWLIVMPWPVWLAAGFFYRRDATPAARVFPTRIALILALVQTAVAIGTVTRVTGFDFPTLPAGQTVTMRETLASKEPPSPAAPSVSLSSR